MTLMKNDYKKLFLIDFLYSLFISILFLLVCSKNSPLYSINDWTDVNSILTAAKMMRNGSVLYKDVFDHKGPISYFLFMIADIISNENFLGLWILEIISVTGFLYFCIQNARIFSIKNKIIYFSLPIISFISLSSISFSEGGSAEELSLIFLSYSLYYFLRMYKGQKLNIIEHLLNGVFLSIVFWMKFNMTGIYIGGYLLFVFFSFYRKTKEYIKPILYGVVGFFFVTFLIFAYFIYNDAIKDLFEVYFYDNIFLYQKLQNRDIGIGSYLSTFIHQVKMNKFLYFPILFIFVKGLIDKNKDIIFLLISYLFMSIGIYNMKISYYCLIVSIYLFTIPIILNMLINIIKLKNINKYFIVLNACCVAFCLVLSLIFSYNTFFLGKDKDELVQFKFAEIINKEENPTLLNYNTLDGGFYSTARIKPINKYYHFANLIVPEMIEEQNEIVSNQKVDFVVILDPSEEEEKFIEDSGYKLIEKEKHFFALKNKIRSYDSLYFYLYKKE